MNVVCTSSHPVDLSDGRSLAPMDVVDDVDTDDVHQRDLIRDGHLTVLEDMTPKKRSSGTSGAKEAGS